MSRRLWIRILLISVQLAGCGVGSGTLDADFSADVEPSVSIAREGGPRRHAEILDGALSCAL